MNKTRMTSAMLSRGLWPRVCRQMVFFFVLIFAFGCERDKGTWKVGFVGPLTGKLSDLGTSGRNGVMLAVEEINEAGGIRGRVVELITRDDQHNPELAIRVNQELIQEGVVAIIGHMTSSMSMAALPVINREGVLMISPTSSSNELAGRDDHFFRVTPPNKAETDHLSGYAYEQMGARKMAAVYDISNRAYSEEFFLNFRMEFERMGGEICGFDVFAGRPETGFEPLVRELLECEPDALLIVAGALDTAMICQQARKIGSTIPLTSSGWAMTRDLIEHGGSAVEGILFSYLTHPESLEMPYVDFKARFKDRFGHEPDFAAIRSYEAVHLAFLGLKLNPDPKKLKETLLGLETIQGVTGDFKLDAFGDPKRPRVLSTVSDKQFKTVEGFES